MQRTATLKKTSAVNFNRILALIYLVMAFGMVITAVVSSSVSTNPEVMKRILFSPWFVFGLFILQIIVVGVLAAAVQRLSPIAALLLFFLYAALTGVSISAIFIYYSQSTIAYTFWLTAGMFLLTSLIGLVINRDLGGLGMFLLLALMGWMCGWIFTWFLPYPGLNQFMNFTGVLIFAGLTTYDTQRLKIMTKEMEGKQGMFGMVVLGALALYLDFINMFLLLLRTSRR
jgi:FtsH-binding integral membrane protein